MTTESHNERPLRVVIIGNGGSGKSTLAVVLAERFRLKHIEIDTLAFNDGFNDVPIEVVNERLSNELEGDHWIVEGMHRLEISRWAIPRAQLLIWLDMPLRTVLVRLLARTARRSRRGGQLVSELRWVVKTVRSHSRRRVHHRELFGQARATGADTVRFRNEAEVSSWLTAMENEARV